MRFIYHISLLIVCLLLQVIPLQAQLRKEDKALRNNAYFYLQHQNYQQVLSTSDGLPEVYDKYLLKSLAYFHTDQFSEARQWLDRGIERYPDSLRLSVIKADVLFFQENISEMLSLFHSIEKKIGMKRAQELGFEELTTKVAYAYQKMGRDAFDKEDYSKSETLYLKALKYESSQQLYLGLCLSLLEQEKWSSLIEYSSEGLTKYPEQSDLSGLLANAYFKTGNYKQLQNIYRNIFEADPENVEKALTLGEVMMANNDYKAAQKHYDYLLKTFPESQQVYEAALQISSQYRNLESRIAILERNKKYLPAVETVMQLAESYQLAQQWDKAIFLYDSLSNQAENPLPYLKQMVKAYDRSDSLHLELPQLRELSRQYPEEKVFSLAFLEKLESQSCIDKLEGIAHIRSNQNSQILVQKAELLNSCGKKELGYQLLQKATRKDSVAPEAYVLLAQMSVEDQNLQDSSYQFLKLASTSLLETIERDEKLFKGLTLSDPFNPIWLEVPQMKTRLERRKESLEQLLDLASHQFKLSKTEDLLLALQNEFEGNALLMFLSGQHYAYHRQKEVAITHYRKAIELEPELITAQYQWARLNEKLDREGAAIMGYEKGNDVLKNALIEALHKQGRVKEAKAIAQDE